MSIGAQLTRRKVALGIKSEAGEAEFNPAYVGPRRDIAKLVPLTARRVLDVGCSVGALGESVKERIEGVEVAGIEFDRRMAEAAKGRLDKVVIGDVEQIDFSEHFESNYFDCVIFADVLEHLRNPWDVLKLATKVLGDDGMVILSIPNVRHYTTIVQLVFRGRWPYRDRGIHDKGHLRFFTLRNIREMLADAELAPVEIKRHYRIIERPHVLNVGAWLFGLPVLRGFLTFQYIICAKKRRGR